MAPPSFSGRRRAAGEELWKCDLEQGSLRTNDGTRVTAVSADWIGMLHISLIESFGETAQDVLYRGGYEWGLRDMTRGHRQLPTRSGSTDAMATEIKAALETWWGPFAGSGWSACSFDLSQWERRGIAFADLKNSVVAAALEGADQPVCHLCAGLFAGAVSYFARAERHAVEIECRALGHASCRFAIGPGTEIDSAESWRQQGTSAAEIARRLS